MVVLGEPSDYTNYIALDGDDAFYLHQAGCAPKFKSGDGTLWFKKNKKTLKIVKKLGLILKKLENNSLFLERENKQLNKSYKR